MEIIPINKQLLTLWKFQGHVRKGADKLNDWKTKLKIKTLNQIKCLFLLKEKQTNNRIQNRTQTIVVQDDSFLRWVEINFWPAISITFNYDNPPVWQRKVNIGVYGVIFKALI